MEKNVGGSQVYIPKVNANWLAHPQTQMSFAHDIQRRFNEEWGGSLLLPDGWYGRPYDNQHALTSVEESGETLTVVLDRKLTLRFEGLKAVKAHKRDLIFGPFEKLHFDWEIFGADGKRGTKEYQTGEVKILTGPSPRHAVTLAVTHPAAQKTS